MGGLLTDEAVEAAAVATATLNREGVGNPGPDFFSTPYARAAVAAFIAHHEGERDCERCAGTGHLWIDGVPRHDGSCPDCNGTGKVREDKLVKRSEVIAEVVAKLRWAWDNDVLPQDATLCADFIEGEFNERCRLQA